MTFYNAHDIETDDAGEIQLENGDLKLASTRRSFLQALNYVIMCRHGEVWTNAEAAGNLEAFIGKMNNARTHRLMEDAVKRAGFFQKLIQPADIFVSVIPVDVNDVALTVRAVGEFYEDFVRDQDLPNAGWQVLGYIYPLGTGQPKRVA